jgi:hypothetical protein
LKKQDSLLVKINDIRQVVASAENYSPKRMTIIFSNTEYRLNDIPGINPRYMADLKEITGECLKLMETSQKESFEIYNSRVGELLAKILSDANPVFAPTGLSLN